MKTSTKRVLLYRVGSLGDTVVALPSFHLVARAFPHSERRLLTNFPIAVKAPPAAAILENTGLVEGYFRYSIRTRSLRELLSLWWQLVRWRPHVLIYLAGPRGIQAARRDVLFFHLCGIRHIIGAPLTEDLQQNLPNPADGTLEFESQRLARSIQELGDARLDDPASWNLHLTPAEHARAEEALVPAAGRPLIAVSIGTKVQANEWPREHWRELLSRLATLWPDHALVFTGAATDTDSSEYLADGWRSASDSPIINLCGQLTPRESAAVFTHARIFLGHDSGPMHLAAAVQTPCVAIFAARNKPRVWFPYGKQHRVIYHRTDCWGCGLETCTVQQKKCIASITVDEVLAQIGTILHTPAATK
ncbi:glycosyltransferase family 9 protein [Edaphobacter sp.]|uniref:glycosyltransferase family 9 protein n=1 Tax=Edaphobacter sp. TaxID=1934404 RepID=UPI002DBD3EEC|nr:glycosyltransferase family 9 protein [Edaphobacter sp.]HEU5341112.1 glycosyltransferase family 9 protein [Edaphobacter sp.]